MLRRCPLIETVLSSKILGEKVVKSAKCIGVSQLFGSRDRAAPTKSTPIIQAIPKSQYTGEFLPYVSFVFLTRLCSTHTQIQFFPHSLYMSIKHIKVNTQSNRENGHITELLCY